MQNRARKEKVANVLFDVAKYILTVVAVGTLFSKESTLITLIAAVALALVLLVAGVVITPGE